MFHSDQEFQLWLRQMRREIKEGVAQPSKTGGWFCEREASNIIKASRKRAIQRLEASKRVNTPSAAYEASMEDVRRLVARYTPAEPIIGYVNVYGEYIK